MGSQGNGLLHRLGDLRGVSARTCTSGWRDTRAAWINIAGFVAMLFNLFIINMVVSGLHSYAGLN